MSAYAGEVEKKNDTLEGIQCTRICLLELFKTITGSLDVAFSLLKLLFMWVTKPLKRASNLATVGITGKRRNRKAGYGLELPCEFKFQKDKFLCEWLEEKL